MNEYKVGSKIQAICEECKGSKNVEIKAHHLARGDNDDEGVYWRKDWLILSCMGCGYTFVMTEYSNSDEVQYYEDENGLQEEHIVKSQYWPALSVRYKPEWFQHGRIDSEADLYVLEYCLTEVYEALDNFMPVATAASIRTCFDVGSLLLGIDESNFAKKLDGLVNAHNISTEDRDKLNTLIDGGNAAIHRAWRPNQNDLQILIEILESFIFNSFVKPHRSKKLDAKVQVLKKTIPPRS